MCNYDDPYSCTKAGKFTDRSAFVYIDYLYMLVSSVKSSDAQGFTPRTGFVSASSNYDFRGQELRKDIETLKQQFDHWILSKKNKVISERDSYTNLLADHVIQVEQSKKIYHQLREERDALMNTLEKEKKELMERESDLKTLKEQHVKMETLKRELEKKNIDLQNKLKREQEIHEQKERIKISMLQKDQPELAFFRKIFALGIEALRSKNS